MDTDELRELFAQLSGMLEDLGLDWIVGQVDDEIAVGKLVTRQLRRGKVEEDVAPVALKAGTTITNTSIVGTEPYTQEEQVLLLINAVRLVLTHEAALESAVTDFFAESYDDDGSNTSEEADPMTFSEVVSVPDSPIGEEDAVAGVNTASGRMVAERVVPLLDELLRRVQA